MQMISLEKELKDNAYPGRGIVIGMTPNGKYAATAYFITLSFTKRNKGTKVL